MVICRDLQNLKITIRSIIVATLEALTVEELWNKVIRIYEGSHNVQLDLFGYKTFFEFLKDISDVAQVHF